MINQEKKALRSMLQRTKPGREIIALLHLSGETPETLGKGFFSKVGKKLKSAGKVTSKITGRIAKVAAGMVGIPPGAIDQLAKVDPTAHKALVSKLVQSKAGQQAAAIAANQPGGPPTGFLSTVKPVYIAAGAAGIIAIIFIATKKKKS